MFDKEKFHKALLKRNVLWPAELLNVTDSTNTQAFNYLAQGRGPIMVLARRQTAGRGTKGRTWFSASEGNLYLSLGFNTPIYPEKLADLGLKLNSAACQCLCETYKKLFKLKWPNDILYENKKLAGLLVESKLKEGKAVQWVIGFGLNVYGTTDSWPEDIRNIATTLEQIADSKPDMETLTADLIKAFYDIYNTFQSLQKTP